MNRTFQEHARAAAQAVGAPEIPGDVLKAMEANPATQQFRGLLKQQADPGGGRAMAPGGIKSLHAEGDRLIQQLLVAFVAHVDQAEAVGPISVLAEASRLAIKGVLLLHGKGQAGSRP